MLGWKGREQVSLDGSGQVRRDYPDRKWVRSHQRLGNSGRTRIRLLELDASRCFDPFSAVPDWTKASDSQLDAEGVSTFCGLRSGQ